MYRRCPSLESGQPTFAAAMSPPPPHYHQQHALAHAHAHASPYNQHDTPNGRIGYPAPTTPSARRASIGAGAGAVLPSMMTSVASSSSNTLPALAHPNGHGHGRHGTPNSHNGYPASTTPSARRASIGAGAVLPSMMTSVDSSALAHPNGHPNGHHGTPNSHSGYPTPKTPSMAAVASSSNTLHAFDVHGHGTPNGHNGYPTASASTAVLPSMMTSAASPSNLHALANTSGHGNGAHGNGHVGGDNGSFHEGHAAAWLQSPAATTLVQRCMASFQWDETQTRRVLTEYTRFCRLKMRMGDASDQKYIAPTLVQRVWQAHYLDSLRYCEDIQSICGRGVFLHYNHYAFADQETKSHRVQSTETALMAMFGDGGVDRDIWTFYVDASTTKAMAASQTIASRAPPGTLGAGGGAGDGAVVGFEYGANAGTAVAATSGGPSSASRRPPSALKSSRPAPMTTLSEHAVSFRGDIKEEVDDVESEDEEVDDVESEDDDDDDDEEEAATLKTEEDSDDENYPEPPPKKKRMTKKMKEAEAAAAKSSKTKASARTTRSSSKPTPKATRKAKTPASKKKSSKTKNTPRAGAGDGGTSTADVYGVSGDFRSFTIGRDTTAAALRQAYIDSAGLGGHLPETLQLYHRGIPLPEEAILSTLGANLHFQVICDLSPVKIDMLDGVIQI